ncbi:MAG: hypothetical protein EBY16_08465 [Gammaproteobacteria bacterium]|nr:hypothetical protein [Gammaproteobacteria bacterium]
MEDIPLATLERNRRVLNSQNARILTAVYFGLLAVVFTLLLDATMYVLGMPQLIPLFEGTLLAMFVASVFAYFYGDKIINAPKPFAGRVFISGFLMTLSAIPFYILGFTFFYLFNHPDFIIHFTIWTFLRTYTFILIYGFLLIGIWLAIFAGLAALYLRSRISYYVVDSLDD